MDVTDRDSGVALAELVGAFSLSTDLGLGQPMEHVLRSWVIAARLGDHVGLAIDDRSALFYVATLAWVGCVADTPELATWFGDDIVFRRDSRERLGLGTDVCDALQQAFARWDGKGVPGGVGGEEISLSMRLFHLADVVEVFHRSGGADAAVEVARDRRGKHFDPDVVDAFCSVAADVLGGPSGDLDWQALVDNEPLLRRCLTEAELDAALEAIADFTDLRAPSRAGHSRAVADLAARAAASAGLSTTDIATVRRAGLVHDLGMHGIPATVLDKTGPLTSTEAERMRMHTYYTERMLARPAALARVGAVASMAHERCDGSGYHRGSAGPAIPATARLLAAACAFCAMTEPRSHRPPLTAKQAASELRADVRSGRLDAGAVDAVLGAAGQISGKRRAGPAGLTPREIEVLALIARGASTRQVAHQLSITPKTAETHIERIYAKIGASTRSTATLFAMQHGLLDTLEPFDL